MYARPLPILLLALLLQSCTYALSSDMLRTADRSVTFEKFQADPQSHKGKIVVFGGTIVRTRNDRTGTLIEILQKDLDYWGKPLRTDRSGGHFLALQPRYLDPLVYAPGRDITLAGEVTGGEERSPGEAAALYPLILAREIKLWPREKAGWDRPQFLDPLYDPSAPQGKYGY